ncbi:MAG: hypothetical protein ACKOYG_01375 [Ilumatobacteraceae bacterium]
MTSLSPGDRVRYEAIGDDGFPIVRYGFVGGVAGSDGPVVVMLDGELGGDVVNLDELRPVAVTTIELALSGIDLVDNPDYRCGLLELWCAEADTAGLDIDAVMPVHGECDCSGTAWVLAELHAGEWCYALRAIRCPDEPDVVRVRADLLAPPSW